MEFFSGHLDPLQLPGFCPSLEEIKQTPVPPFIEREPKVKAVKPHIGEIKSLERSSFNHMTRTSMLTWKLTLIAAQ